MIELENVSFGYKKGRDILDVACGTGVLFPYYYEKGVASVTGIDISGEMVKKGYETDKVLMVGDAPGDRDAAVKNGVWYYPILVGKEGFSWERLLNEAFPKLLDGSFDEAYQAQLIREFEANLGV